MSESEEVYIRPEPLTRFLDGEGLGSGALSYRRVGEGQSNLTYLIEREGIRLALRRGPRPPFPPSAHDMLREARILRALSATGVPVPAVRAVCEQPDVLGVPFYVMDFIEGLVITDRLPAVFDGVDERRAVVDALVDGLVDLHDVDVRGGELAALGKPEGYLHRQVRRFVQVYEQIATRELPEVVRIAGWLGENLPASPPSSVVHGDFRLGNIMFAPRNPPSVAGIMDWEMATIGDPLADLGYMVATYPEPGSPPTPMDLSPVTRQAGFPSREDLVERYARRSGRDVDRLDWYETLALWKAAVFCEAIHTRWLAGERPDDHSFGPTLKTGVPLLLELARETAGL